MIDQIRNALFAADALIAAPISAQSLMIIDGTCQVPLSTSTVSPAVGLHSPARMPSARPDPGVNASD